MGSAQIIKSFLVLFSKKELLSCYTQSNPAVWGRMKEEVRWNKGPPSLAITEHWNYDDRKDFFGGYCWMGQGPLPIEIRVPAW
jgi:hypothetical protein